MADFTREQFAQHVIGVVRNRFPLAKVARAPEPFSMKLNGRVVPLESLYRSYLLRPDQMDYQISRWVVELIRADEGMPDRDAPFDELADRIMPIVVSQQAPLSHNGLITQPLVEGLNISYVIDGDRTIAHIPSAQLRRWEIDVDTLHQRAIANLLRRSDQITADAAQDDSGQVNFVLFQTNDGYDSSRLLLPNLHDRLRPHLGSPFLAAIPNRDILLCFRVGTTSIEQLREQVGDDYRKMPHQVTDKLFLITPDGVAPYVAE